MTLAPLLAAPFAVQLHAGAALAAFGLGLWQIAAPKGGPSHRRLGWTWVGLMLVVALSSFAIAGDHGFGVVSPIHALSLLVLAVLPSAVLAARKRRIAQHRAAMLGLFLGALVIAGAFTLLPGRIMGRVVFG